MHLRTAGAHLIIVFSGALLVLLGNAPRLRGSSPPIPAPATQEAKQPKLVIVQVRDEVYAPGRRTSKRVDDYAAIVKDGWYHSADDSFRLRIPTLESGRVNVVRRRWEKPDGVDVKFVDEDAAQSLAVFSFEPDLKPWAEALSKQYSEYLSEKGAKFETNVIHTDFGQTVETVAIDWVFTTDYPYEPPAIDASEVKRSKLGVTVGINWTFWKGGAQCGLSMILPVDGAADKAAAFALARAAVRDFAKDVEFKKQK